MLQGFQNIWICIFLKFLRIYIEFTSFLVWKRKRKNDFYLRKGPWKKFSSRGEAPGRRLKQGSGGRPDSGAWGCRRRGGTWGKARERREEPRGGLGWARGCLR